MKRLLRSKIVPSHDRQPVKSDDRDDISSLVRVAFTAFLERQHRYPGRIDLFRASDRPDCVDLAYDAPTCGWGTIAAGGVEVWHVPGDHRTMLDPPNLVPLATAIRSCIQAACAHH